ncbi:hypothetical protein [Streptomyces sp. NPDC006645]|uniref:hypothetical protein n=1 Tax=unclassified Streptomyces TaxID=2593676 RepID=UPI0033A9CDFF
MSVDGTTPRWARPAPLAALLVLVLLAGGVLLAALGQGPYTALAAVVLVVLVVLLVTGCVILARSISRATAREIGLPQERLRDLSRRAQQERIPPAPAERMAMRRLLAKQRLSTARLERFRRLYVALGALFVVLAVVRFLDGAFLLGAMLLFGGVTQLCQPLLVRRTLSRLDRVDAALDAAGVPPLSAGTAPRSPRPNAEK